MVAKKRIHRLMKTHFDIDKIVQNGKITKTLNQQLFFFNEIEKGVRSLRNHFKFIRFYSPCVCLSVARFSISN